MLITSIDVALGPKYLNEPKVGLFMGSISTANNSLRPFRALQPTLILSLSLSLSGGGQRTSGFRPVAAAAMAWQSDPHISTFSPS
jgi:hypothetical protein